MPARTEALKRAQLVYYNKNILDLRLKGLIRYHETPEYKERDRLYQQMRRDIKKWLLERIGNPYTY